LRIASNKELVEGIKDSLDFVVGEESDTDEALYVLTTVTKRVTELYRRIEEEDAE